MRQIARRLLERRRGPRFAVSQRTKILFMNGSCQMDCTVIEMSKSGARLQPADAGLLPNEFDLLISPGKRVKCEAIHRSAYEIGVKFFR